MLTSAQSIVQYDFQLATVNPDRLTQAKHHHYLRAAEAMLCIYRSGPGQIRNRLHQKVQHVLDRLGDCPPRRAAAFCKLLDDRSQYHTARGKAAALRRQVFTAAASLHPLVSQPQSLLERSAEQARSQIAAALGRPWDQIQAELFADVIELQTLCSFQPGESFTASDLLSAYNVGQTQAALYRATRMTLWAGDDLKTIARHIKLAGLMHRITRHEDPADRHRLGSGDDQPTAIYRFELDGAASSLRETWRYGIRFARVLPMLLVCARWRLSADLLGPGPSGRIDRRYRLNLSPRDGLKGSHREPAEFDSQLEQQVFQTWHRAPPAGWSLSRESELLHLGQSILTPDFVLRRKQPAAEPIYVELVGYWTPEYLREKARRLQQFRHHRWIVIAPPSARQVVPEGIAVLELKNKFDPESLVALAQNQGW